MASGSTGHDVDLAIEVFELYLDASLYRKVVVECVLSARLLHVCHSTTRDSLERRHHRRVITRRAAEWPPLFTSAPAPESRATRASRASSGGRPRRRRRDA